MERGGQGVSSGILLFGIILPGRAREDVTRESATRPETKLLTGFAPKGLDASERPDYFAPRSEVGSTIEETPCRSLFLPGSLRSAGRWGASEKTWSGTLGVLGEGKVLLLELLSGGSGGC